MSWPRCSKTRWTAGNLLRPLRGGDPMNAVARLSGAVALVASLAACSRGPDPTDKLSTENVDEVAEGVCEAGTEEATVTEGSATGAKEMVNFWRKKPNRPMSKPLKRNRRAVRATASVLLEPDRDGRDGVDSSGL